MSGRRPVTQAYESFPSVLPGPLLGVEEKLTVDGVADTPLEGAEGFFLGLALGDFAVEVGTPVGVGVAELGHRRDVEGVVELVTSGSVWVSFFGSVRWPSCSLGDGP